MNKIVTALAVSGLVLSGCGERWQQASCKVTAGVVPGDKDYQACMAADNVDNFAKCQSYGAIPGSSAYVQCMATLAQGDAANSGDGHVPDNVAALRAANAARLQSFINGGR